MRDLDMDLGTRPTVNIVEVEPRLAAVVRKRVPFARIPETQREARVALTAALTRPHAVHRGTRPTGFEIEG